MRLIIEARLEGAQTSASATEATIVAVVERQDRSVADLGLTLTEGRALQVRVADLNGEFSLQRLAALAKMPCTNSPHARQAA